ncbi:translation initiation factor IF-2 [Pseudonocardia parietis]|uniref:DNA-directed RNA polymerase specialized sigma24 family protein n=1 Tax=Pseudonocardia parietis TaxID=570936 RepID=A0ABS4W676_9PSEU|nr:translation initiation factor IF-2 [Pseudonocardia parietis]MBP2371713.1 DNA-directed RNA polymerase specialized sigma24 family protein [Pseudonocardia parietis]
MAGRGKTKADRQIRDRVAELAAARDRLDAEEAERRRREDEAFERYARADADAVQVAAERDAALADLEAQSRRVSDDSASRLGEIEQRQREILAELHRSGRKVDDLAAMFELPVKRVRTFLRQVRPPVGPQSRAVDDSTLLPSPCEDVLPAAAPLSDGATDSAERSSV